MRFQRDLLFLSHEDVLQNGGFDMDAAISELEKGFFSFDSGNILQPQKTTLKVVKKGAEGNTGLVNFLPSYVQIDEQEIYCCKLLGAMPSNVEVGLPRAVGLITLFDPQTKAPICIMDGQVISAIRTGAISALAAKKIVPSDIESVGLIGAGVNMRTQLLGISKVLKNLKKVFVHSRHESKYEFAEKMSKLTNLEIIPVTTAKEAVIGQKFIITCLPNGVDPVVKDEWISEKGVTIFNIGGHVVQETALARMDRVIADIWEHAKQRASQTHAKAFFKSIISEDIIENITPIITGNVQGRTSADQNIFFCPTGMGFADAIIAHRVYSNALKSKSGQNLRQWEDCQWI